MTLVRPSDFKSNTTYHHDIASCPLQSDQMLALSLPLGRMTSLEVRCPERGGMETLPRSRRPSSQDFFSIEQNSIVILNTCVLQCFYLHFYLPNINFIFNCAIILYSIVKGLRTKKSRGNKEFYRSLTFSSQEFVVHLQLCTTVYN